MKSLSWFKVDNFKDFLTTSCGVAVAQLIALLSIPFIARVSGPEVFGQYSLYNAIVLVLCVFSSFKLEYAVFTISWRLYPYLKIIFVGVLVASSVLLGVGLALFMAGELAVGFWMPFSLISLIFGLCVFEFSVQDNIKQGYFKKNSLMRICRAVSLPLIFILCFGFVDVSAGQIIFSFSLSNILSVVFFGSFAFKARINHLDLGRVKTVFQSCRNTIVYLVPAHFMNRYSSGALILLAIIFSQSAEDVAKYALIEKLIIAPASIFTNAISDVVKRDVHRSPLKGLKNYYKLSIYSMFLAAIACVIVILLGEDILALVMGERWLGVYQYALAILPYFCALLVISPITHTYTVLNKQKYDLLWQVFHAASITAAIAVGFSYSFIAGVWFYSIAASCSLVVSFFICRYLILDRARASEVGI